MHAEDVKDLEANLNKQCDGRVSDTKEEMKETCV